LFAKRLSLGVVHTVFVGQSLQPAKFPAKHVSALWRKVHHFASQGAQPVLPLGSHSLELAQAPFQQLPSFGWHGLKPL